ncbi:MAG: acyl-CoA thioesterase [Chloracidobacterium sp.]|nr:acyl-CoA thioesterase [Chloracidobacterium sp.]
MDWHESKIRVRYAETDAMGIVHHANYLTWFEVGRSDFCRSRGFSYKQMEDEDNALMIVAETYIRYKAPAFYEDVLTIRTKIGDIRSRSIAFVYQVYRDSDDTLIAEAETLHVFTDWERKVRTLPDIYRNLLSDDPHASFPPNQAPH